MGAKGKNILKQDGAKSCIYNNMTKLAEVLAITYAGLAIVRGQNSSLRSPNLETTWRQGSYNLT